MSNANADRTWIVVLGPGLYLGEVQRYDITGWRSQGVQTTTEPVRERKDALRFTKDRAQRMAKRMQREIDADPNREGTVRIEDLKFIKKTSAQLDREILQAMNQPTDLSSRDKAVLAKLRSIGCGEAEVAEVAKEFSVNTEHALAMARDLGWTDPNLCSYCGKPTRKGSALIDGQSAHKSCIKEFEES